MLYKFGVIRALTRDGCIYICGSIPQLGSWSPDESVVLQTSNYILREPSFWTAEIEINDEQHFEYKFLTKYLADDSVEWEGCGSEDNRDTTREVDLAYSARETLLLLTPTWWKETDKSRNEFQHTTAFYYNRVVRGEGMHLSKILDRLWLGSCPRQLHHVDILKRLGVDTIMTLQTEYDIINNCSDLVSSEESCQPDQLIDRLESIYRSSGMAFVWLPCADMSTPARRRVLPEGVALLKLLMDNGRTVYVHCNAGVGRSAAIIAGYLMYVKRTSLKEVMYFMYDKRPAVYIDGVALTQAKKDFLMKYCSAQSSVLKA